MKKLVLFSVMTFIFVAASITYAGFNILKEVQKKVEQELDEGVDKSIDAGKAQGPLRNLQRKRKKQKPHLHQGLAPRN